ncbi:MAG TPA: DoxX family protein [Chitinophagaceae bacterium]|nr:DoxX family protein [Chitinophagaceae bacterium]
MKKIFSTRYADFSFNLAMLLLRAGFGLLLFYNYGLSKLMKFEVRKDSFSDPLNIGSTNSMMLTIFAETFCTLLLAIGLLSRLASLALVVFFIVILFVVQKDEPMKEKETALLFLMVFLTTLLCGPGKWSVDNLIGK